MSIISNVSCSQTTTRDKITERDGIVYKISSRKPFTGTIKEKATEDNPSYEGQFVKGRPEGKHTGYAKNDSIIFELNYLDGELHGDCLVNDINETHVYHYQHGKKDGIQFEYYDHQRTKKKSIQNFKNGILDGEVCHYYENGNIEELSIYKDGKLHGEYIKYYENGALDSKGFYVDDKFNGARMTYYKDGAIYTVTNFENGKKQGKYICYNHSGSKWIEIDYVEGKKHGKDIMYKNEVPFDVRVYEHGERVK